MPMPPKPDWMTPEGSPWRRACEQTVFDNPWLALRTYDAVAPTGAPARYGVVHFKTRAIGVLPLFDNGDTLLVGQHRFPLADYSWEIPEGGGALAEDPLEAARRELREEAGLAAEHWRPVLSFD